MKFSIAYGNQIGECPFMDQRDGEKMKPLESVMQKSAPI